MSEMKVLCAGFGRTGTLSMRYALEDLGIPCYHNNDMETWHYDTWCDLMDGKIDKDNFDFSEMFHRPRGWFGCAQGGSKWHSCGRQGNYAACCDWPMALFYKEMLKQWPDAKVVLTTRDVDGWMNSFSRLMPPYETFYKLFGGWGIGDMPQRFRIHQCYVAQGEKAAGKKGNFWDDREIAEKWLNGHIAEVKAHMKAIGKEDQLLVYSVKEGYGPLCKFLGVEVPSTPFPRANSKLDVHKLWWIIMERIIKGERWRILFFLMCIFVTLVCCFVDTEPLVDQILEVF